MIDVLFEQRVAQNPGLAAEALWQAVNEFHDAKSRSEGVPLPLAFLVLPLVFHQRSATALSSKTQPGALYKAIAGDREITAGLQARVEALSERTFQALYLALDSRLLVLDPVTDLQLLPGRKTQPVPHVTQDVRTVLAAAKRVGRALAESTVVQLLTQLRVTF